MAGSIKVAGHELVSHDIANDKLITGSGFPAGHVIQVEQEIYDGGFTTTVLNNDDQATGFYVDIQPKKDTSKILIMIQGILAIASNSGTFRQLTIKRDSTTILFNTTGFGLRTRYSFLGGSDTLPFSFSVIDSPSSDAVLRYELFVNNANSSNMSIGERGDGGADSPTMVTAMEIAQ